MIDPRAVVSRMLKQLKVPDINELMPNNSKPKEIDAADENAAMALGKPAFAYPRQDQLAHIQTHLAFAMDPALGSNPLIAQAYIPLALEHIKQHMMLWYTSQIKGYVTAGSDIKLDKYESNKLAADIDKAIAMASEHVKMDTGQVFEGVIPALQQMGQIASQFKPPAPPMDGEAQAVLQASMAETQRRAAADQAKNAIDTARLQAENARDAAKLQADQAMNAENNLTAERMKTAQLTVDQLKLQKEQEQTALAANNRVQQNLRS